MSSRASQRPGPPADDEPSGSEADQAQSGEQQRTEHDVRHTFERILPELIRRGFEVGRGPLEKVSESIFPREIASQIASQLGDVRSGVVKAVAQEVGRFLREADIASELRKVLTGLTVEAKVQLRFDKREDGTLSPKLRVELEDDRKKR